MKEEVAEKALPLRLKATAHWGTFRERSIERPESQEEIRRMQCFMHQDILPHRTIPELLARVKSLPVKNAIRGHTRGFVSRSKDAVS